MRRFLVDTPLLAAYLHQRRAAVDLMSPWIARREVGTSVLVYAEVVEYLKGLPDYARRHHQLRELLIEVHPYLLTFRILERYADVRRQLRPPHGPGLIGDIDTLIAATALERSLTVVTTDRDFERVPGLKTMVITLKT